MKLFRIIVATPEGATSSFFSGMSAAGAAFHLAVYACDQCCQKAFIAKWMKQAHVGAEYTHVVFKPMVQVSIQRMR